MKIINVKNVIIVLTIIAVILIVYINFLSPDTENSKLGSLDTGRNLYSKKDAYYLSSSFDKSDVLYVIGENKDDKGDKYTLQLTSQNVDIDENTKFVLGSNAPTNSIFNLTMASDDYMKYTKGTSELKGIDVQVTTVVIPAVDIDKKTYNTQGFVFQYTSSKTLNTYSSIDSLISVAVSRTDAGGDKLNGCTLPDYTSDDSEAFADYIKNFNKYK